MAPIPAVGCLALFFGMLYFLFLVLWNSRTIIEEQGDWGYLAIGLTVFVVGCLIWAMITTHLEAEAEKRKEEARKRENEEHQKQWQAMIEAEKRNQQK